jgi:hypothetical protein
LDFQEFKKQKEAQKFIPIVGCNEVKYRDNLGKMSFKQLENNDLLELGKSQYDKKLTIKD